MTVQLHQRQSTQDSLYASTKPLLNNHSITKDENTPPQNGNASEDLHPFVPQNVDQGLSMHAALQQGDGPTAWRYIQAKCPFLYLENGESKVVLAIKNCLQHKPLINYLIACAHPRTINYTTDTTALIEAAKLLDAPLVTRLLQKGANPNPTTPITPLSAAIRVGGMREYDDFDFTSEQIQKTNEKMYSVVHALLAHRAAVDCPDSSGDTPLQALFNKILPEQINPDLVTLLITYGANPATVIWNSPSPEYRSAITLAITRGKHLNQDRLQSLKKVSDQTNGANPATVTRSHPSPAYKRVITSPLTPGKDLIQSTLPRLNEVRGQANGANPPAVTGPNPKKGFNPIVAPPITPRKEFIGGADTFSIERALS